MCRSSPPASCRGTARNYDASTPPYDGGADVILATPAERDRLRGRHTDRLSRHPAGL
ncbi:DUF3885 domain-containing protein [Streptomyces mirabilis]|uniref:DUF3885 domain-containing protein n=1 Tax=Streptomyces mirabilis TaxID=68239 RepID=UPI003D9DB8D2